jgi:putative tryptophan/tyrosine transport system substrate-binding protein
MRRRSFITLLGSAAVAWPLAAHAQQPERMRRIGLLEIGYADDPVVQARTGAVREGLEKLGWVVGRNLTIDYRWGVTSFETAQRLGGELLSLSPDVILCAGSPAVKALQQATHTVPIVFVLVAEPVAQGFVASLAHPGANVTGLTYLEPTVGAKWLELLTQIAPQIKRATFIFSPKASPYAPLFYTAIEAAAAKLGVTVDMSPVNDVADLDSVMAKIGSNAGVIFNGDGFVNANRDAIAKLAARYSLPAVYGIPHGVPDGLIYYSLDAVDQYRQSALYVDRILRGEKLADLPVQQPTKFQFTINLKTARALGLVVPPSLLAIADEVIE